MRWQDDSVEGYVDWMMETFGPLVLARQALGERGDELRDEYIAMVRRWNKADGDALDFEGGYLETIARV